METNIFQLMKQKKTFQLTEQEVGQVLELLCPKCKGKLREQINADVYICARCNRVYLIWPLI